MQIINVRDIPEKNWASPKGKFGAASKELSVALGRKRDSTDLTERHPFDVEICRIPAGKALCPFHSHSAQWEFYHVLSGRGKVRHSEGSTAIESGDAFVFPPDQPHQLINDTTDEDLIVYIIADNPIGESCYYPDSRKWLVRSPERRIIQSDSLDYFQGEE